ncbi:SPRY domain-containing protein 7-like [Styela clava]
MALTLDWLWRCFGFSSNSRTNQQNLSNNSVVLNTTTMGTGTVIVKNGKRICGTGGALATAPIAQDKGYFEAKVQSSGIWGIGLALANANLNHVPLGMCEKTWVFRHDGTVWHKNNEICRTKNLPAEGDVVGVTFDHIELKFYLNGKPYPFVVSGVKGNVYPVLYVDESAILDVQFSNFYFPPPSGFSEIMIEQQIF